MGGLPWSTDDAMFRKTESLHSSTGGLLWSMEDAMSMSKKTYILFIYKHLQAHENFMLMRAETHNGSLGIAPLCVGHRSIVHLRMKHASII